MTGKLYPRYGRGTQIFLTFLVLSLIISSFIYIIVEAGA